MTFARIERVTIEDPEIGEVVCLRQVFSKGSNGGTYSREASASKHGVWEWNSNTGEARWQQLSTEALMGKRPNYHQRSQLRRMVMREYRRIMGEQTE